jgi:superfamily I DNA/RNA helicase
MASADAGLLTPAAEDTGSVTVRDVETLAGSQFDVVFLADVRAGSWPAYYVPDAFLFMRRWGMIPKDNVGDARAARTAKFTWAFSTYKFREAYNDEARRAFYLAATRARKRLFVTAWGRPTRGRNTPELLAELEARHP